MKLHRRLGIALSAAGVVVMSCSADRGSVPSPMGADASVSMTSADSLAESPAAAARIAELRTRFRLTLHGLQSAALGESVATRFDAAVGPDAGTHVRAQLASEALRGVARAAHVALPMRAGDEVKLEDATSLLSVRFALEHVQDARIEVTAGMALYRGAFDGADVVHRVHAEGTEDFVVFETRPAREELSYSVDVSRVPGLRLVSNTLEFLDDTGTPLLRVAPPYVVAANGQRHEAKLAVSGCAYDTKPAGPWGRKVTKPGAERCRVHVAWAGDVAYPAMVDPAWAATGAMATARGGHTESVLPSGKVLVAGGHNGANAALASAELFNPAGNAGAGTFAATGSMATARDAHTASVLPSGKVLVAGGDNSPNPPFASAELFDPAGNAGAGTFAATGSMATARGYHTASVLPSGKVLVAGGHDPNTGSLSSAELFDPAGNAGVGSFATTGDMATARFFHTASVLPSGKVLVAGGWDGLNSFASAELFDPAGNAGVGTFAATGAMTTARLGHTSSVLASGRVLVAGGQGDLASAELFDPAGNAGAGTFAAAGSMVTGRKSHTANVLPSGKVLVVGGTGVGNGFLASAEFFDPTGNAGAGTFAAAGSMAAARYSHTASVLPSGKVLVAGGANAGLLATAELFSFVVAGGTCATSGECASGFCADGVCCNTACSGGGCDRCDLPSKKGTCSVAPSGDPGANVACAFPLACDGVNAECPTSCTSDAACAPLHYCAGNGSCLPQKSQAAACNTQTDCKQPGCRACTSGFCVDGVCCDTGCTDQCQACDDSRGSCVQISGKPHGSRAACPPGNLCTANASTNTNHCAVPTAATCDGDHTTTGADGTKQDCTPYKCDSNGTCRSACSSVNDCVAPTICDPSGKCVPPPADTVSDGGCSVVSAKAGLTRYEHRFPSQRS